jgi:hypothetical protein
MFERPLCHAAAIIGQDQIVSGFELRPKVIDSGVLATVELQPVKRVMAKQITAVLCGVHGKHAVPFMRLAGRSYPDFPRRLYSSPFPSFPKGLEETCLQVKWEKGA